MVYRSIGITYNVLIGNTTFDIAYSMTCTCMRVRVFPIPVAPNLMSLDSMERWNERWNSGMAAGDCVPPSAHCACAISTTMPNSCLTHRDTAIGWYRLTK